MIRRSWVRTPFKLNSGCLVCLCGIMRSPLAWTRLMHWVACSRSVCGVVGRHIASDAAQWLQEPSNIPRQIPEIAIKMYFTLTLAHLCFEQHLSFRADPVSKLQEIVTRETCPIAPMAPEQSLDPWNFRILDVMCKTFMLHFPRTTKRCIVCWPSPSEL